MYLFIDINIEQIRHLMLKGLYKKAHNSSKLLLNMSKQRLTKDHYYLGKILVINGESALGLENYKRAYDAYRLALMVFERFEGDESVIYN